MSLSRPVHAVIAVVMLSGFMVATPRPASADAFVSLSTYSGPPGTYVVATGSGFSTYLFGEVWLWWDVCCTEIANAPLSETGSFSVGFYIPADATPGPHIVQVDVCEDGCIEAEATFIVTSTSTGKPDLVVTDLFVLEGSTACAGGDATFLATFDNQGSTHTGQFNVRFTADGVVARGGHGGLGPGGSGEYHHVWRNLTVGSHSLTFLIDDSNFVDESDEGNNSQTISFTTQDCDEPPPVSCPTSQYTAAYYNNTSFSGAPALVRCEDWPIAHNWGEGSPGPGVASDYFTVRWTGRASIESGVYQLWVQSDDGIRVWLDNQLTIDRWSNPPFTGATYSDLQLSGGTHDIRVEYVEYDGAAHAAFRWDRQGVEPPPTITAFSANPSAPSASLPFTLTATVSSELGVTPYWVTMFDGATKIGGPCGFGTTCSTTITKPAGTYTFQARLGDSNGGSIESSRNLTVVVGSPPQQRSIELDPNSGGRNTLVKVTGRNFLPSETVYLSWGGGRIVWNLEPVRTDGSGSFTGYFSVPGNAAQGQSHTVSVSDGAGSASSTFHVNSAPPQDGTVTVRLHVTCIDPFGKLGSLATCDSAALQAPGRGPIAGQPYTAGWVMPGFEFANVPRNVTVDITVYYTVKPLLGPPESRHCVIHAQTGDPFLGVTHVPSRFGSERCGSIAGVGAMTTLAESVDATHAYADLPVASGAAARTWLWGPGPFSDPLFEPYNDSTWTNEVNSAGVRYVVYYDKSRMEITDPNADPNSAWYVTNGLLVVELVTGNLQLGHNTFEQRAPAEVNVAGDQDDPTGPTYRTFNVLRGYNPFPVGSTLTQRVNRDSQVTHDGSLAQYGVTGAYLDTVTNHTIASPFWDFMNAWGTVYRNGSYVWAPLFENPFYATGRPITEAYWARVKVGGTYKDVLIQCFERRCLTYTPGNPVGWQVEAGNVGQHYYIWRYGSMP